MTTEQEVNQAELYHENRRLWAVINDLIDELESEPGVDLDTDRLRSRAPDRPGGPTEAASPPWDRAGYGSKDEWLDDIRDEQ